MNRLIRDGADGDQERQGFIKDFTEISGMAQMGSQIERVEQDVKEGDKR